MAFPNDFKYLEPIKYEDLIKQTHRKNGVRKETKILVINEEDENSVLTTLHDFADVSTVHGLHYIFKKDQNWFCRLFWILTVLMGGLLSSYW